MPFQLDFLTRIVNVHWISEIIQGRVGLTGSSTFYPQSPLQVIGEFDSHAPDGGQPSVVFASAYISWDSLKTIHTEAGANVVVYDKKTGDIKDSGAGATMSLSPGDRTFGQWAILGHVGGHAAGSGSSPMIPPTAAPLLDDAGNEIFIPENPHDPDDTRKRKVRNTLTYSLPFRLAPMVNVSMKQVLPDSTLPGYIPPPPTYWWGRQGGYGSYEAATEQPYPNPGTILPPGSSDLNLTMIQTDVITISPAPFTLSNPGKPERRLRAAGLAFPTVIDSSTDPNDVIIYYISAPPEE